MAHKKRRQAGKRQLAIRMTATMIKAGVEQLVQFNRDFEREEDAVARIYRAMRLKADEVPSEDKH